MIHATAIIDPSAKIGHNVHIGAYTVIGAEVEIGDDCWIGPHVVINGPTKMGRGNRIFQFSSIGEITQDLKYNGERTYLEMGDYNTVREFCTINRGSIQDKAITRVGNHNLFMAYVHIAHDCVVGNHVVFSNNASLAGHVHIDDHVVLGGFSGVFQFCRVGAHSFVATNSVVIKDVPPFVKVSGYYAKPYGLNSVGLQRRGFTSDLITELKRAYKIIYRNGLTVANALEELKKIAAPEVQTMAAFIEASESGIVR